MASERLSKPDNKQLAETGLRVTCRTQHNKNKATFISNVTTAAAEQPADKKTTWTLVKKLL
jgi:hypothetical protein